MAPEASGAEGPPLNVNADDAAAAIAGALRAAELLLISDVSGVEVDGAVRPTLEVGDVETLIELGVAADGMAAKLRAATAALHAGARAVRIGDVRSEEHTSELQSQSNLVCRLLLEKKKIQID